MKKFIILCCILICSCRSIKYQDVNPIISPNRNLLPALETLIDINNLEATYTSGSYVGTANNFGSGYGANHWGGWSSTATMKGTYYKDARVNDIIYIFNKEVKENIISMYGVKRGYIVLKLGYREADFSSLYRLSSILTLGTINFLGFPADKISQSLEVEVEIWNNNREVIKRYVEHVVDSEYVAMYWGYNTNAATRKVAADNIKQALEKIRIKIGQDATEIKNRLR